MSVGKLRRALVVLAICLVAVLALSLVLALLGEWRVARATQRFEATLGRVEMADLLLPEVPEAENAATWLAAGAAAIVTSEEPQGLHRLGAWGEEPWDEEKTAVARGWVGDNGPALELLRRAAACPRSTYGLDYRLGPDTELPPYGDLLRAAWLLGIDARLAMADGDRERLRLDLATLDRLAGSLARESLLITALLALAVDRQYMAMAHRAVTGPGADPLLLAEVEAALNARDRQAMYLRALAADGSIAVTMPSDAFLANEPPGPLRWVRQQLLRPVDRWLMAGFIDEYTAIGELVHLPWPEIVEVSQARVERGFPRSFAATLYPNLIDSVGKLQAGESARRLALEAIRQRRAQLAGGGYATGGGAPWVDPYTGQEVTIEPRPGGELVLEAPGALRLWRESHSVQTRLGEPHFTWVLPAAP